MIPAQAQQKKEGTDIVFQGRMVWGSVKPQQEKIYGTNNFKIDPKTGQPAIIYKFGIAIPKIGPQSTQAEQENFNKVWNAIFVEAGKLGVQYPNANFAFKFDDGDGKKADGTSYPEHSRGCIILSCKTNFALGLSAWEGNNIVQVSDDQIKCGDYVQVAVNVRGHGTPNAGLYINPSMVCRFAFGEAITNAPSPQAVFGAPPAFMPPGASQTPIGGMPMMGAMGQPQQAVNPFAQQQPAQAANPFQQQAPAPMQNYQQPGPAPMTQPAQPPQYQPNMNVLPPQFQGNAPAPTQQGYAQPGMNVGGFPTQTQGQPTTQQGYDQAAQPNAFPSNGGQQPIQQGPPFNGQQQTYVGFPAFPGQQGGGY